MRGLICCLLVFALWTVAGSISSAVPADSIYVELLEAYPPVSSIYLEGPLETEVPARQQMPAGLYEINVEGKLITLTSLRAKAYQLKLRSPFFVVRGLASNGLAIKYSSKLKRYYRGVVRITIQHNEKLHLINIVSRQDYVTSVVGSETLPDWPLEALKCQAVLTQTRLARYKPNDLLGDSTQAEVYLGAQHERPEVKEAVNSVWGNVLTHHNCPIVPFYHAVCGGKTSNGGFLLGKPQSSLSYLANVACQYCSKSPFFKTKVSVIPWSVFNSVCGEQLPQIVTRDAAGRPLAVKLANNKIVSGYDFWIKLGQKLGWDKAPGTKYSFRQMTNGDIVIESVGAGHGVGLCQWGSAEQAKRGKSYREILQCYFPGTKLSLSE